MENRDEKLWQLAAQRAKFKGQILTYFAVNIFLWVIWFITSRDNEQLHNMFMPWPAWISLGWGFSLISRYIRIYHIRNEDDIQKEYDKLKNK